MLANEVRKTVAALNDKEKETVGETYLARRKNERKSPTSAPAASFVTSNVPMTCWRRRWAAGGAH